MSASDVITALRLISEKQEKYHGYMVVKRDSFDTLLDVAEAALDGNRLALADAPDTEILAAGKALGAALNRLGKLEP